jgi:hypothetical protein
MHAAGDAVVGADGLLAAAWRHGHDKLLDSHIDAGRVGVGSGVDGRLHSRNLFTGVMGGGFAA